MKNFKKKFFSSVVLTVVVSALLAVPAFANGGSTSFDFTRRMVDGSSNGVYYTLTTGSVHVDGSAWLNTSDHRTADIEVELRKPSLLGYKSYGQYNLVSLDSYYNYDWSTAKDWTPVYWNVDSNASNYYLVYYCASDYVEKIGVGTLYDY